ncbi:hypothetical protein NUW54_g7480 [Trametes sanguinea]|uniref:Uncharacterized protein n=1 Tax=Trametes sanguinea TaxID=158606 RepID=A0ACC1PMT3_9APHY|nr:hypothetical protein NUW54_g7480 [Trametes sanguinea]
MGRSTSTYKRQDGHPPSLISALSAFVRRILHIPMADDVPTLSSILGVKPEAPMDEAELQKDLNRAYQDAVYLQRLNPDRARICKLRFMKDIKGLQHEYILAYVTVDGQRWDDPDVRRLGVMLCERDDLSFRHTIDDPLWAYDVAHTLVLDELDIIGYSMVRNGRKSSMTSQPTRCLPAIDYKQFWIAPCDLRILAAVCMDPGMRMRRETLLCQEISLHLQQRLLVFRTSS